MQPDETVKKLLEDARLIKKELARLSSDTLTIMSRNREIARSYVQEAIAKTKSEQPTEENIESVVDEIQNLAKTILEERLRK